MLFIIHSSTLGCSLCCIKTVLCFCVCVEIIIDLVYTGVSSFADFLIRSK